MFRKKRKKESSDILVHQPKDRRKSFRVKPSDEEPVFVEMAEKIIPIYDISTGGIAFENHKLKEGQATSITINLPDDIKIQSIKIRIIFIDVKNLCHAKFIEIEASQKENIHRYTLKRQVEMARKKKEMKYRNWHTRV